MTNNESIRDFRLKQLFKVMEHEYNDMVGYNENAYLDGDEEYFRPFTLEDVISAISNTILKTDGYLEMENTLELVEAKHFRFFGESTIREAVRNYCSLRYRYEGFIWEKETR